MGKARNEKSDIYIYSFVSFVSFTCSQERGHDDHVLTLSKKLCKKEPKSFSHCGFLHHPDLQSLNNYIYLLFCVLAIVRILGLVIHCSKSVFKPFPMIYYKLPTFLENFSW